MEKDEAMKHGGDENYYVNQSCYGQIQPTRKLGLMDSYWLQRGRWDAKFKEEKTPTVKEVYLWLMKSEYGIDETTGKKKKKSVFQNIGSLTALLICGDLIEANVLPMPTAQKWGDLIADVDKGGQAGMVMYELVPNGSSKEEISDAFVSLDLALQQELRDDEKEMMGYNVVMLEHSLCKIKRLTTRGLSKQEILYEL